MKKYITSTIVAVLLSVIANQNLLAGPLPAANLLAGSTQDKFEWKQGQGIPGVSGTLSAVTTWSPDANGPQPKLLVVGGEFTVAGNVLANNIAAWDGNSWHALGSGMNGDVFALTVYNGQLIAGGDFTRAGDVNASNIARWDGSRWQPLGSGMVDVIMDMPVVTALTVYNGQLIAAGWFTTAGGVSANSIAQWDGSSWQPLGSGVNNGVSALTVYNGQLIAGGDFTTAGGVSANRIAQWDGSNWQPLGDGTDDFVQALTVYNGQLIAGGYFITAWDGSSWQPLRSGLTIAGGVITLAVYDGQLIAGGGFNRIGDLNADNIAAWDGNSWQALGNGMNDWVTAFTVYDGQLIAEGSFTTAGGVGANCIAQWDGSNWNPLGSGMNHEVYALTVYNDQLITGGRFTTAGSVGANYIAAWDGSSWYPLGGGMNGYVYALTVYNGQLIAAGAFTTAGGVSTNYIAAWDGSSWHPLGTGMGGAYCCYDSYPVVYALTVYNGQLIAGGLFETAGGVANNIARWDGSNWQPLGSGLGGWMDDTGYPYVSALTAYNGQLIAGGYFSTAGGVDANSIAQWDGSSWHVLGGGMKWYDEYGYVEALMVYNGQLIAGGSFATAGGVSAFYIAVWDGSGWQSLGGWMQQDVEVLTVYNGQLIAGGNFTFAGSGPTNYVAAWDGNSWQPLGSGTNGDVYALTVYNGELFVGGDFTTAGGQVSAYWARWGPINHPPVACIVGGNKTLEAQGPFGARVRLDGSCSSDADSTPGTNDDINDFNWYRIDPCNPNNKILLGKGEVIDCNLPLGKNTVMLEVIDKAGATDSNEITVTVQDTTPPDFKLSVTPTVLWPPNHKMVRITPAWTVHDLVDPSPVVSLVGITSNGNSAAPDDIQINNDGSIYLRAEKGTIYTITYKACDASGNCTTRSAFVTVPHDNGK